VLPKHDTLYFTENFVMKKLLSALTTAAFLIVPMAVFSTPASAQTAAPAAAEAAAPAATKTMKPMKSMKAKKHHKMKKAM